MHRACFSRQGQPQGSPSGQNSGPFTKGTQQMRLLWPGVQARHSPHGLALDTSSSVSGSEGASVSLSPKSPHPALGLPRSPQGSWMNRFIQQYKLSTYCVPGHGQGPSLMALSLAWKEDVQIEVQLQERQVLSRAGQEVFCGKILSSGEASTKKRESECPGTQHDVQRPCGGRGQRGK